ncbi:hypothetical protein, partial [Serratia marcescens]|uniref:hypothetical protein n=1 Tax=Serratia marcescens TaxID=615 RepID=UPI001C37CAC1
MMKKLFIGTISLVVLSFTRMAVANADLTNPTGGGLVNWDNAAKSVLSGKHGGGDSNLAWINAGNISCIVSTNNGVTFWTKSKVSLLQSSAVVRKYLDDNPGKWKERAGVII